MRISYAVFFAFWVLALVGHAQQEGVNYLLGETFSDRHKYSNMVAMAPDDKGGTVVVRSYFQGVVLKPKGYLIEHYNEEMELLSEYNYKLKNANFVEAFVRNGQVYLLFLEYDLAAMAYTYTVHRSPFGAHNFTSEVLLTIPSEWVAEPLDRKFGNRDFSNGFTTSVLFNEAKSAFAITTHVKRRKVDQYFIHVFDANLNKRLEHDFSDKAADKNYAFENVAFSTDLDQVYLTGKAYPKKSRFKATERRFQYEVVRVAANGAQVRHLSDAGKFPEALKPIIKGNQLLCLGFYADRKDNRYNGIVHYALDPTNLEVRARKYNAFTEQFMQDKFGREDDASIKNLVFKSLDLTDDGHILFNAEEQFTSTSIQSNSSGGRVMVTRYHYNDIVSVKLDGDGNMLWARNINKTEVTQGDDAYTSYAAHTQGGKTHFFISSAMEQPQALGPDRIMFKQGFSKTRNLFLITLDAQGAMTYKKLIDSGEARLPLMVSRPLKRADRGGLTFYAKRGSKKQLVQILL
ncbi:hypothetical protein [Maribacter sp. 2307ULW6-5]|uniref:hypothetical protein n=1 Tax=Maribacter sp. 2307ULW6-5 TaxID=3386275 RepID=UPI0039BD5091